MVYPKTPLMNLYTIPQNNVIDEGQISGCLESRMLGDKEMAVNIKK